MDTNSKDTNDTRHFTWRIHMYRYIMYNHNLGVSYYLNIDDAELYGILIQASINTDNQLIVLYNSTW